MNLATRKAIAALRAAAKVIRSTRRTIFNSHIDYSLGSPYKVSDPGALEWIAEQDDALAKIDAAIKAIQTDNKELQF